MIKFAVIGLDHRHVYHLIEELLAAGASCVGYWTQTSDPLVLKGVQERFPQIPAIEDRQALLEDADIDLIVTAAIPSERAGIAIEAMRHGKDVLTDKPGIIDFEQLALVERTVRETGKIFSICFSERMVVPAVQTALRLVADGAIGDVIQTLGMGPHRLNRDIRPDWFFDTSAYGGILIDIASHQIDQFMMFTDSEDAEIVHATVGHFGPNTPESFQDFGEITLHSPSRSRRGYIRVDWFTPDGLPTWGDGRLFVLGTEGSLELRKYVDLAGRSGTDHLYLADKEGTRYINCQHEPLVFFRQFIDDVRNRSETAMRQSHVFTVSRLALEADAFARGATQ
ncbi:Gfo/Idh/MocA family oxidoreductase [Candidimonas sp. SYP-B2681]|uniref:Gfo/Idh/MocA family protein n=1 Tax=Candidimonas sp. SYP-B2681 TaxID=2497686 RepID=UPI000F8809F4|nr:Gfo/Idh/MocA family oxidoreductase [Candidimonas sp. SYP-B2681]RTZ45391.1 Gfo/Idh/MocA family oxidoreductase [Candidimonas sp. SYP-B2681]